MVDLKAQFGDRWKITWDQSAEIPGQTTEDRAWLQQIPGKYGHIFIHGADTLGVYVRTHRDATDRLGRLLAIPGAKLHQRGDHEASVTFPVDQITQVAGIIQAKRRVRLSAEHRAQLIEASAAYRFLPGTKGPQRTRPEAIGGSDRVEPVEGSERRLEGSADDPPAS